MALTLILATLVVVLTIIVCAQTIRTDRLVSKVEKLNTSIKYNEMLYKQGMEVVTATNKEKDSFMQFISTNFENIFSEINKLNQGQQATEVIIEVLTNKELQNIDGDGDFN